MNSLVGILSAYKDTEIKTEFGKKKELQVPIPPDVREMIENATFEKFIKYVLDEDNYEFSGSQIDVRNEISYYMEQADKGQGKIRLLAYEGSTQLPNLEDPSRQHLLPDDKVAQYIKKRDFQGELKDCLDVVVVYWTKVGGR